MASPSSTPLPQTGDSIIDATTHGYYWNLSTDRTIHWAIADGFYGESWTNAASTALILQTVFDVYAYYANVNFQYVGYYDTPYTANLYGSDITISMDGHNVFFDSNSTWAIGLFPNSAHNSIYSGAPGDVYLNLNSDANYLSSYTPGSAGFFLAIHEIGHTLGLKHPHDNGGTGRPTLSSLGLGGLDIDWATAMSYNDDANWNLTNWDPATPMLLDVLALQYLYGPNMTTNAGDSTYTLPLNGFYVSIWDASGNDEIDVSESSVGWSIILPNTQLSSLVSTKAGYAQPVSEKFSTPINLYWLMGDIENAIGSNYADEIFGNDQNNYLEGKGGNDTLAGGNGADVFLYSASGNGVDTIDASTGDVIRVFGSNFSTAITYGDGSSVGLNQIQCFTSDGTSTTLCIGTNGIAGADVIINITGSLNIGRFNAYGADISIVASPQNHLPSGSVTITGAPLKGQTLTATNTLSDIDGIGVISYQWRANGENIFGATTSTLTLTESEIGKKISVVASFTDTLGTAEAVASSDTTKVTGGTTGKDKLTGSEGGDLLDGGEGADNMAGGMGDDIYVVDNKGDKVSEKNGEGDDDTVQASISYKLGKNLENLILNGNAEDNLKGTGNELANSLTGDAGNNVLDGGKGVDSFAGGEGDDTYLLDDLTETVTENADAGTDLIKLNVKSNGDYTLGDNVENLTITGAGQINVTGNSSDNTLTGNAKNNTLSGLAGNDTLDGGKGSDTLTGGTGNDNYKVDTGDKLDKQGNVIKAGDSITEASGEGTDTVISTASSYTLSDNLENLTLSGAAKTGIGNSGNNTLTGSIKANVLQGGAGDDTLIGGKGGDTLTGGDGNDLFVFDAALKGNIDKITDFVSGADEIQLDIAIFTSLTAGTLSASSFYSAEKPTAQDADDFILYDTASGKLYYDADANGSDKAVQFATLTLVAGVAPSLAATDLSVV